MVSEKLVICKFSYRDALCGCSVAGHTCTMVPLIPGAAAQTSEEASFVVAVGINAWSHAALEMEISSTQTASGVATLCLAVHGDI